jgi:hypothetical protein
MYSIFWSAPTLAVPGTGQTRRHFIMIFKWHSDRIASLGVDSTTISVARSRSTRLTPKNDRNHMETNNNRAIKRVEEITSPRERISDFFERIGDHAERRYSRLPPGYFYLDWMRFHGRFPSIKNKSRVVMLFCQ